MKSIVRTPIIATLAVALIGDAARAANGCVADWTDLRGTNPAVIRAPDRFVLDYQPRCALVSAGATVTFDVLFRWHPTFGGTVVNDEATFDPTSPIGPWGDGTSRSVVLVDAAEYPYFCDLHYTMGMSGSVLVVPEMSADGFESPPDR